MKKFIIALLFCPLALNAMYAGENDKYFGVISCLVNGIHQRGNTFVSPIAKKTFIYAANNIGDMRWVTTINDYPNQPDSKGPIHATATQYDVYLKEIRSEHPYDKLKISYATTESVYGQSPIVKEDSTTLSIGSYLATYLPSGIVAARGNKAHLLGNALNLGFIFHARELSHDKHLEECPNRYVSLLLTYLRMNAIQNNAGQTIYVPSDKQDLT